MSNEYPTSTATEGRGIIMSVIVYLLVFGIVVWLLTRGLVAPPPVMAPNELHQEGLTPAQTRKELRVQRSELRQHQLAQSRAMRTANRVGRSMMKAYGQGNRQ
jgi:hypothetical protein